MRGHLDLDGLVERVAALGAARRGTVLIGIDGCGGAGKSLLADRLQERVGGVSVVRLDDFMRPQASGFDVERLRAQVLEPLASGRAARYQRWDWPRDSGAEWHDVAPGGIVVIEGVGALRRELDAPYDLTVWVETPAAERLRRGVERDGEAMRATWVERWMPAEDAYLAAERPDLRAEIVIDGATPGAGAGGVKRARSRSAIGRAAQPER